ncbi:glycerophosphodiester phosphodiesterase [Robertmurraya yapensis]|uniref:Glycerophosphodiester phosphodiesterase n=2 Tax=Bacillaceae TaxID=186817 RepID=A0A431WK09_9BACI|nr:glycerophosphodiester phosphodiesterase family protein [Bacillus yapensis]RTR35826.1 glycerophosphodiester phosphodiesterase [Bacillus yapensis]TKS98628.1 glycerophosphodiester phosphodiesterase [Bacillus yapensis]
MKKKLKIVGALVLLLMVFIFLNNTSLFVKTGNPTLLAHRGMAQTFPMEGIEWDTCTAEIINEPEHSYLENTIPSMEAAFAAGADVVEFDIKRTKDNQLAVFHDFELSCRTDGKGSVSDYTMEELKQLDVGYGYTADGGKTFPFRGKGLGLMPSLTEVLTQFPERSFLIHIKSSEQEDGELLAQYLKDLAPEQRKLITVYGDDVPMAALKKQIPEIPVMSMATLKRCMLPYIAVGWTGYIPNACENTQLHLPERYARWMWGWPNKFVERMESVGTNVAIVAGDGAWSEGFDTLEDLERLPSDFGGQIWTNRIELIAPKIKNGK